MIFFSFLVLVLVMCIIPEMFCKTVISNNNVILVNPLRVYKDGTKDKAIVHKHQR